MAKARSVFSSISLLAATMLVPAGIAQAQTDNIIVIGSRSGDGISSQLLGSSVTLIDNEALLSRQTRALSDILRDVPGVAVNRNGAFGGKTQVRIRGTEGNHVLVFIDGIKASDSYQGEFDFGTLMADEGARVEVLRGQQSSLYGSDAIGGVISYTTLSGREAPGVSARAEGGSFGTFATAGRVGGTIADDFDYVLSATYLTTKGYPVAPGGNLKTGSNNLGTSAKLNWTPGDNFRLTGVFRYSYTKADLNDQGINASSPIVQGYPVNTAIDTPDNYTENKAIYGLVRAELDVVEDSWTTALSGQITDIKRDTYSAFGYDYGNRGQRYRGTFENTVRFGTERFQNRFTFAVDAEREEFRVVDPSGFAYAGKHRIDTLGFVADYDLTIDERLALGASARIENSNRFNDAATYRVNGSYLLPSNTRIHAAWGTGVKAPNAIELFGYADGVFIGNADLAPEYSRGWEAGIEQSLLDGQLLLGATWFQSRFYDQIETVGTFVNGNYASTTMNNNVVSKQRGIEAYATARFGDWRVDATYTWMKALQTVEALADEAPADGSFQSPVPIETQAVRRPRHIGSFNLSYAPEALPFSATVTVRYNGKQRDYAFNSMYQYLLVDMKAFTLVNFAATFDVHENVQLFGRVENLLNKKYQEVFTFAAPGRAAYGGVRVNF